MKYENYINKKVIAHHSNSFNFSFEKSEQIFNDLKVFLLETTLSNENLRPTIDVDKMWHTFILHTEEYHNFCNTFFKKYIHHRPKEFETDKDSNKLADCELCEEVEAKLVESDCYAGGGEGTGGGLSRTKADCVNVQ